MLAKKIRKTAFLLAGVMVFGAVGAPQTALAATEVKVYLDGNQLSYTEVEPQIMNGRTMVPLTETAAMLGMTNDEWDNETKSMVFSKEGRIMTHTLYENNITVNGDTIEYDVISTVISGRTLMPVGMLSDAIGAKIRWDGDSKSVYITTTAEVPQDTTTPATTTEPEIISITTTQSSVAQGDYLVINVEASLGTTKVRLQDETGYILGESSAYAPGTNTRIFSVPVVIQNATSGYKVIMAYPGNEAGLSTNTKQLTLPVSASLGINSVTASSYSIEYNDTVTLTIAASANTTMVKVVDSYGYILDETTQYTASGSGRNFTLKASPNNTGANSWFVYAGNATGYLSTYETVRIDVDDGTGTLKIIDIDHKDSVDEGDTIKISIDTSKAATKVEVQNKNGKTLDSSKSHDSSSSTTYTWDLSFPENTTGTNTYTVIATDKSGKTTKQTFKVKVGEDSKTTKPVIHDISLDEKQVEINDYVVIDVYTNTSTTKVWVDDRYDDQMDSTTSYKKSGSYYVWTLSFKASKLDEGSNTLYIYARNSNGDETSGDRVTVTIYDDED